MKRAAKFKILKRQDAVTYVNPKVKAFDLLSVVNKAVDKHRVLMCIQVLMKKGKSEKALNIIREVVYNLFKEESERRSSLGGLYYIIDGIKRLEHVLFIMPIKKKGRVRYKKAKILNQQKSISKAVQLLMKHAQEKVVETQQSYVKVLTKEFKELYTGLSVLYRKSDEIYQEIITLRYRRRYTPLTGIYLAKYRKKNELLTPSRKRGDVLNEKEKQFIKKMTKGHKNRKKTKILKSIAYRAHIKRVICRVGKNFKYFIKKKKRKLLRILNRGSDQTETLKRTKNILDLKNLKNKTWSLIYKELFNFYKANVLWFIFYNILNNLTKEKENIKYVVKCLSLITTNKNKIEMFILKQSILFIKRVNTSLNLKSEVKVLGFRDFKTHREHWFYTRYVSNIVNVNLTNWLDAKRKQAFFIKKILFNTLDYYYVLMYKYHKHYIYKIRFLKKMMLHYNVKKVTKLIFYPKKRKNIHRLQERVLIFPHTRLYSKIFLEDLLYIKEVKKKYYKVGLYDIVNNISISLKDLKVKKTRILFTTSALDL